MSLNELFITVSNHPLPLLLFFTALPLVAWVVGGFAAAASEDPKPLLYSYAALVYAACIPGIFALTLNIYLFLFERQSIWESNLLLQFVPILSMILTLIIIKSRVSFALIPGFGKISGFLTLIAALMGIMWFVDRLRLYAFMYVPFSALVIGFVVTLLLIRFAWNRLF